MDSIHPSPIPLALWAVLSIATVIVRTDFIYFFLPALIVGGIIYGYDWVQSKNRGER